MSHLLIWRVRETQGGAFGAALSELASQRVSPQSMLGHGPKACPSIHSYPRVLAARHSLRFCLDGVSSIGSGQTSKECLVQSPSFLDC